jgi:AraC family transcriptional regulator
MADSRGPSSKIEIRLLGGHDTATVRETVARDSITEALGGMYQAVGEVLRKQGISTGGNRFARYHTFGDSVDLEAGFIVPTPIQPDGSVKPSKLPAGPAAIAVHRGPYEGLADTYEAVRTWLERSGRQASGGPWEIYITDPSSEPNPNAWLTEILWPLRSSDATG